MLKKVIQAVNEYFRTKYSGDVGILWNVDTHQDIIYISCKKWGVSDYYAVVVRDHANDPDYWTQISPPEFPDLAVELHNAGRSLMDALLQPELEH